MGIEMTPSPPLSRFPLVAATITSGGAWSCSPTRLYGGQSWGDPGYEAKLSACKRPSVGPD
eukprot:14450039-Alexandrium_andersonii.AAC.1